MNYLNHNLRVEIQEMLNRLRKSTIDQFAHNLKFFFDKIDRNQQLLGIINEKISIYNYSDEELEKFANNSGPYQEEVYFDNEAQRMVFSYLYVKFIIKQCKSFDIHRRSYFSGGFREAMETIIDDYLTPIVNFLHDQLDKSNSILYLLEKYKKRVEWFTKQNLLTLYKSAEKSYEQILEDDLRLFLFDQGIDYPFSTPKSTSGRADIVGNLETDDPIVIEVKIFDKTKGYDKKRIYGGFTQIVKYANDYVKSVGFLVIYNFDDIEINFKLSNDGKNWPPSIIFNQKTFYFILVNCFEGLSASKKGGLTEITITSEELTSNLDL